MTTRTKTYNTNENTKLRITLELKNIDTNKPIFSCCGEFREKRQLREYGQCLDIIPKFLEKMEDDSQKNELRIIYNLWKLYHLNDLHADCIHNTQSIKNVKLYTYRFKGDFFYLEKLIKRIENNSSFKKCIKISNKIKHILNPYGYKFETTLRPSKLSRIVKRFYYLDKIETKSNGCIFYNKDFTPDGLLGKPCPICGSTYGTTWYYHPIPDEDLQLIKKLIET